jgi:hypothetical protein
MSDTTTAINEILKEAYGPYPVAFSTSYAKIVAWVEATRGMSRQDPKKIAWAERLGVEVKDRDLLNEMWSRPSPFLGLINGASVGKSQLFKPRVFESDKVEGYQVPMCQASRPREWRGPRTEDDKRKASEQRRRRMTLLGEIRELLEELDAVTDGSGLDIKRIMREIEDSL